jgi:hypothetical protein
MILYYILIPVGPIMLETATVPPYKICRVATVLSVVPLLAIATVPPEVPNKG